MRLQIALPKSAGRADWSAEARGLMPKSRRKAKSVARGTRRRRRSPARPRAIEIALAGFAHDIRTPLTGILSLADLLAASDLPERERDWAAAIKEASEHLARLTTLVVDAAKADSAGIVLRADAFSPRALAESVAASLGARAAEKGLKVRVAIAVGLPDSVLGDEVRLRSALENLVDNAVKFTDQGAVRLDVSAAPARSGRVRLEIAVTDSGVGIAAADLKRLFQPFAQANADVVRRYGGAGLGLMLVKRIAAAMGGSLVVKSRRGHGSMFRLRVVVEPVAPAGGRGAARRAPSVRLRVLCVDDNPYSRIVLKAMLGELGHRVTFAGSGEAAVEAVSGGGHDAVLMDLALPDNDGVEAARRIRALPPPAGRIPIIGISGRNEANDAALARTAGIDAYLRKPASSAELSDALRAVAGVKRAGPA
jgi:signal transduction histidine kinase/CheY-like chemotaxis protein